MSTMTRKYELAMAEAASYEEWRRAAGELDRIESLDRWREEPESEDYDYKLLASRVKLLRTLRRRKDIDRLIFRLRDAFLLSQNNFLARLGLRFLGLFQLDRLFCFLDGLGRRHGRFGFGARRRFDGTRRRFGLGFDVSAEVSAADAFAADQIHHVTLRRFPFTR